MYLQQQYEKPEIKNDENRKIKLLDINFNLETLINSKSKKQKRRKKYEESSWKDSDEDLSVNKSDYEPEPVKKKTKKKKENFKKRYCTHKKKKRVLQTI